MTTEEYLRLITAWHRARPRFVATVAASVDPFAEAQVAAAALPSAFDLDIAVGAQLDVVGEWVGRSRVVPSPYFDTYFSLDDPLRGLDMGVWRQRFDPDMIRLTADDTGFRRILRAKILINGWDGTRDGAEAGLSSYFDGTGTLPFIEDKTPPVRAVIPFALDAPGQGLDEGEFFIKTFALDEPGRGLDQSRWATPLEFPGLPERSSPRLTVALAGTIPPALDLAAFDAGYLDPKPAGVTVTHKVASVDGAPLFGLDMSTDRVAGLDIGAWGIRPAELIRQLA